MYSHDGSRPHCDVLFMPYQFIMIRPVPTVKMYTHVDTNSNAHMCTLEMVITEEPVCVCACLLVRIFKASRACMSEYVEQCVPDAGHTNTQTSADVPAL